MSIATELPRAERRLGRLLLVAVPAALVAVLVAEALVLPTPWLPVDEAAAVVRARGGGGGPTGPLYPLILSPLARTLSASGLLEAARIFGALCWAGLFAPAYALARRSAGPGAATAAAALAVAIPGAVFSTAVLPDAFATLLAGCALWLAVRASERGARAELAAALALSTAAACARPWFAGLPLAIVAAYAFPRVRRPRPFELAAAVAALYGLYYGLGSASPELAHAVAHPWAVLRSGLAGVGALALGVGLLPAVLAGARTSVRPTGLVLAFAAPALAFAAGLAAPGNVEERPLAALVPLVLAVAVAAEAVPRRRLIAAAVGVAATLACVPWPGSRPTLEGAPSLAFARGLFGGSGVGPALVAALALVVAALVLRAPGRVTRVVLLAVVAAFVAGGELTAWSQARSHARTLDAGLAHPRSWVDRAVGADAEVGVVASPSARSPEQLAGLELWNRSVRRVVVGDPGVADPATGALPLRAMEPLALGVGVDLAGEIVARGPDGSVVRVRGPLRVASVVQGVYADGWSGADASFRRFTGNARTIRVTISRRAWGGHDVPGNVSVVSSPIGGPVTARRETVIHAGEEVQLRVPVPPAPFEVDVHVDPTFSPAQFGQGDVRRLGAQLRFTYPG